MSKKSYKKLQNRLYREIKRRIIAEQTQRVQVETVERYVVTLKTKYIIPSRERMEYDTELLVKGELAQQLLAEILSAEYIKFSAFKPSVYPDQCEMEAAIDIALPRK